MQNSIVAVLEYHSASTTLWWCAYYSSMVVCLYYCYNWDEPERAPHYRDFIEHMFVYENVLLSVHFYFCENSQNTRAHKYKPHSCIIW